MAECITGLSKRALAQRREHALKSRRSCRQNSFRRRFARGITPLLLISGLLGIHAAIAAPAMVLPGQLDVSARGAATYSIPITVPPGTGGMVPALTLDYSSQSGNGTLGVGWSLGGLPSVGRCPKTQAQDSTRGAVNYDANDRFCMEGERLIIINGTYGADGSEYRTEIEGFSKIIAHGTAGNGPAWFEVHTKTGQIMEFGNTADSRIEAQGKSTVRAWAVNKISDTKGDYLTVTYIEDATNGQAYPDRIDYTGNAGAGLSPYNSVQFAYNTSRPDPITLYHAGSLLKTTVLLTNVKTYQDTTLVSDYQLTYELGDGLTPSKVTAVKLCAGDGSCLPQTTFGWQTSAVSFAQKSNNSWGGYVLVPGDWDGDGRSGLLRERASYPGSSYLYNTNEEGGFVYTGYTVGWDAPTMGVAQPADWDGDGKTDIALFAGSIVAYRSTGSSFTLLAQTNAQGGDFVDLNADGRSDAVRATFNCDYACYTQYYYSVGNGDGTFTLTESGIGYAAQSWSQGDINNDGRIDYVGDWGETYLSSGTGLIFPPSPPPPNDSGLPEGGQRLSDLNGDGNADALTYTGSTSTWVFSLSKGDRTFVSTGYTTPNLGWPNNYSGEFNGDGRADLIHAPSGSVPTIYLSTGTSFVASGSMGLPALTHDGLVIADFNGDGVSDLMVARNSSGAATPQYVSSFTPTLLNTITTGLGATTTLTYLPLTKSAVYTKDNDATYPTVDVQGPIYVVSRIDAADGIGGTYSSTYQYVGAKADLSGRGFLGFRQRTITDLQTGVVQTTTYRQDFPYTELIASETKTRGGLTLNSTINTFGANNLGGTRNFVFLSQSVKESTDLDATVMPTVTTTYQYDAYGNPTEIAVSTPEGGSKTTISDYINDAANWFLGRLTQASVTADVADPPPPGEVTVNQPPVAADDSKTVNQESGANTISVLANDYDPDNDSFTITAKTDGSKGTVAIVGGGSQVTYTPNNRVWGADSFTYTIDDGHGHTVMATVNVTINQVDQSVMLGQWNFVPPYTGFVYCYSSCSYVVQDSQTSEYVYVDYSNQKPACNSAAGWSAGFWVSGCNIYKDLTGTVNQPPVAVNDSISTLQGTPKTFDPRSNDSDADGDTLTITLKTNGAHGAVAINGGTSLTYTPSAGYTGADSFVYTISDGHSHTASATVTVTVTANQPPEAVDDAISASMNVPSTFDPRTNDSDPESDPLTITAKTDGAHGTVSINGGTTLTYTPATDYTGADSFTYTISDGHGHTDTATVNVTVTGNQPPVGVNDSKTVNQESGANSIDVLANDSDPNSDPLTVTDKTDGAKGTVAITGGGTQVTYTPNNRVWGADSFTYTISDGNGGTATATVNVTINQVDETVMTGTGTFTQYYSHSSGCYYTCWYTVFDTRTSATAYASAGPTSQPPACNSTTGWVAGFWAPSSGCKVYKDLTP